MPCMASPRRISGRYSCCCAGVPNINSALAWIAAPMRGASLRSIVSMKAICSSAERDGVEMDALEMQGRLVLLGIADGAERMLRFERDTPQRLSREGSRAIGEIAPMIVVAIMQLRRMVEHEADAFERDKTVRELV